MTKRSKNPNQLNNKPFESQLTPYFATIKEMRQRRNSWVKIVEYLKTVGITTSSPAVYQFMKRHVRRPKPYLYTEDGKPESKTYTPQVASSHRQSEPTRRPTPGAKASWYDDGKVKPKKLDVRYDDGTKKYAVKPNETYENNTHKPAK